MTTINAALQKLLDAFAVQAGGKTTVSYQNLLLAFNASNSLIEQFNESAASGKLLGISFVNSDVHQVYFNASTNDASKGTIFISRGTLLTKPVLRNLFSLAHELEHLKTSPQDNALWRAWTSKVASIMPNVSSNYDITNLIIENLDFRLKNEGIANLNGWNTLLNSQIELNGGQPLSAEQLKALATPEIDYTNQFIDKNTGQLVSGYTQDAMGYITFDETSVNLSGEYFKGRTMSGSSTLDETYIHRYGSAALTNIINKSTTRILNIDYSAIGFNKGNRDNGFRPIGIQEANRILLKDDFDITKAVTLVDPKKDYQSVFTPLANGVSIKTTTGMNASSPILRTSIDVFSANGVNTALTQDNVLLSTEALEFNKATTEASRTAVTYSVNGLTKTNETQSVTNALGVITVRTDANGDGVFETTLTGVDANKNGVLDTQKTGTAYANSLTGTAASDELLGLAGNDTLKGLAGGDMLDGGAGADSMLGGAGDDVYVVDNTGDRVTELVNEGTDTVNSSITYTLGSNVERLVLTGITAINGTGNTLNNQLIGNSASNTLTGGAGNDTLSGWQGADTLVGGAGNDTYLFARNDGADQLLDSDAAAGNMDVLWFNAGVDNSQLWFKKSGANLEISVIGTNDKAVVQNWYNGAANQVEQIKSTNGKTLLNNQVDALVNAMAAFTPPVAGELTLSPTYQTALSSVIAANWQ